MNALTHLTMVGVEQLCSCYCHQKLLLEVGCIHIYLKSPTVGHQLLRCSFRTYTSLVLDILTGGILQLWLVAILEQKMCTRHFLVC